MDPLRQWRDVYEEVIEFSGSLERLPEKCECGDAEAHLGGRCRCCHGHVPGSRHGPGGKACGERIARLRADLALLCEDFKRAAGAVQKEAPGPPQAEVRRGVLLAAGDLERIIADLALAGEAVVGFRKTCSASEMKQIKIHCAALREHCERIQRTLQGL